MYLDNRAQSEHPRDQQTLHSHGTIDFGAKDCMKKSHGHPRDPFDNLNGLGLIPFGIPEGERHALPNPILQRDH